MSNATLSDSPRRRARRRRIGAVLVLVMVFAVAGVVAWPTLRADPGAKLTTATVRIGSVAKIITAVGSLKPRDYVDVGTQVSGQLQKVHVGVGDRVEKGQLIAEIDPTVYSSRVRTDRANLQNLAAQLDQRKAELELAQVQLKRNRNMLAANAVSRDRVDEIAATVKVARAQVQALQAQIEASEATLEGDVASLGYTKVHAPMSGTVTAQTTLEGATVNASQSAPTIVTVANLDVMTAWAQVAEADISRITPGMPVYFSTLGMPEQRWEATVRQVRPTPETDNDVVLYNVLIDVDNTGGQLLPSMTVQVFFVLASARDVPTVPTQALKGDVNNKDGRRQVTVLGDGGLQERQVTIGVSDRQIAEVREGLRVGEQVVVAAARESTAGASPRNASRGFAARL